MKTTTEFKKQFIYKDESRIDEALTRYYYPPLRQLNALLPLIEKRIGRALTLDEKIDLSQNKGEALLQLYRPQYQFPNADDSFNLQSLGVNISDLLQKLNELPGMPKQLAEKDGAIVLSDDFINDLEEGSTQYTQNENQNKAFQLANKFIEMLHEAKNLGMLSELELTVVPQSIPFIDRQKGIIVPNRYVIGSVK